MSGVEQAIKEITRATARAVGRAMPFRATVTAQAAGLVEIRRVDSTAADNRKYARVAGFALADGDVVLCANLDGEPVVIGKVQIAAPASHALDVPLVVPSINTPVTAVDTSTSATVGSTTNTATYQDAMTTAVTLPIGSWTVRAIGGLLISHSAGQANIRIDINGSVGTARTLGSLTTEKMVVDEHSAGVTGGGSIDVKVTYKCQDAGTAVARNPWVVIIATRTS